MHKTGDIGHTSCTCNATNLRFMFQVSQLISFLTVGYLKTTVEKPAALLTLVMRYDYIAI